MKTRLNYSTLQWALFARLLFSIFIVGLVACGGGSDNGDDKKIIDYVMITGDVTGSGGLADVKVSASGVSTKTDVNGFYELKNIPLPEDGMLVLTYEKAGYATFQRSIPVKKSETYAVSAKLLVYHYSETVNASILQNLQVSDPDNPLAEPLAYVEFPAGSLGSGNKKVSVAVGNPTTETGRQTFPGDYMAASTAGEDANTPLESLVFTEITVTSDSDAEVSELSEPAIVTLQLPDSLQSQYSVGDEIEWWSYDESKATWIREDADPDTEAMDNAKIIDVNGVLFAQAKATHLSWWNVDKPIDQHACVCVNVVDDQAQPSVGDQVIAEGVSYNGRSRPARTDENGQACVTVKRSSESVQETIRLFVETGGVRFHYDITDSAEGDVDSDILKTPTQAGSTIYNSGQCVNLENEIVISFNGNITGKVIYENSGNPIPGLTINTNFGNSTATDNKGEYQLKAPVGVPVSVYVVGLASDTVTIQNANTPAVINFTIANQSPVINSFVRTPTGTVANGQAVTLVVSAADPDGDSLAYVWSANFGSFDKTNTSSVVWTAPASGTGSATVKVDVSDAKGGVTSQTVTIVYGTPLGGSKFSLVIKDNYENNQPVEGVIVALYNNDNVTIASTKTSNTSGVVDFGDIGRNRASFMVAYEDTSNYTQRFAQTFIDVNVAENIVFHLDDIGIGDVYNNTSPEVAKVNITFDQVANDIAYVIVQPDYNYASQGQAINNMTVREDDLQDDGKISWLALAYNNGYPATLLKYGFLTDQTVTEGSTYNISVDRLPVSYAWQTTPAMPLSSFGIDAYRKGSLYNISSYNTGSPLGSSGNQLMFDEFPADQYRITASSSGQTMSLLTRKRYDNLPQTLNLPMPDYGIDNLIFNDNTKTFSWTITGETARDVLTVEMSGYDSQERGFYWSIVMDAPRNSWQLMELPSPVNTWIDISQQTSLIGSASVMIEDFDFANGLDEMWAFYINGGNIFESANQIMQGHQVMSFNSQNTQALGKGLTIRDKTDVSVRNERVFRYSLSSLRRQ